MNVTEFWRVVARMQVSLSAAEVFSMLLLLSVCSLLRFNRLGLLVSFLFTFRLGWLMLESALGHKWLFYLPWYAGFGVITVAVFGYALWRRDEE